MVLRFLSFVSLSLSKYKTIVVFIVGGATYEEAQFVHTLNESNVGVRIILGGSTIQNSQSFVDDILRIDDIERSVLLQPRRTGTGSISGPLVQS